MMKLILTILLYILNVVSGIQYGTNVLNINQYPFYIMIGNPHICGGTLLSYDPPFVLTAAHCVADSGLQPSNFTKEKNPYFVNYYDVHRENQKSVSIINWTVHPLYNVSGTVNMNYDVAIVQLATPLKKSDRVKRVPLWSPTIARPLPTRGELIGFGFTGLEEIESRQLKRLQLDITKFEPTSNVEARSDTEQHIACHGDSGSPLVVYDTVLDPVTHKNVTVPFVVGNLARIFGAHDESPTKLTCPIPHQINHHSLNSSQNTVYESFCNTATMLDWISDTTDIPVDSLSDPFYSPPCTSCSKKDGADEEGKGTWHIGVHSNLDPEDSHLWIGGINQDFLIQAGPDASNTLSLFHQIHFTFVFLVMIILVHTLS
ncbi:trypsin-like cysteine/serine peptidase domain-containing protein [Thamnidium elegans]|nr:trypsin-like cysteine/serine peptidase domain-containing protein [Thamnidium elegans]